MQDDQQLEEDGEEEGGGFRMWLEDNLRIILSILVVFAIAGGIYSYSQRSQAPAITEETINATNDQGSKEEPGDQTAEKPTDQNAKPTEAEKPIEAAKPAETAKPATPTKPETKPTETAKPATKPTTIATESKETETSFIEVAAKGDSATRLARQATANFLEKNPDSTLSKEHKVYIEDYLRKHVSYGHVRVGTSMEFSKSLIQEAIEKSKQLNSQQLANLKKYADRIPSLR